MDAHPYSHADADTYSDSKAHQHADAQADTNTDFHSHSDTNCHADTYGSPRLHWCYKGNVRRYI